MKEEGMMGCRELAGAGNINASNVGNAEGGGAIHLATEVLRERPLCCNYSNHLLGLIL